MNDLNEISEKTGILLETDQESHGFDFRNNGDFQLICGALSTKFGEPSGRGIIFRTGGVLSRKIRQLSYGQLGLDSNEVRFASTQKRIQFGINQYAKLLEKELGITIQLENTKQNWILNLFPKGSQKGSCTFCQLVIGIIMEYVDWAGSGNTFVFGEKDCFSQNKKLCSFVINKTPLDA